MTIKLSIIESIKKTKKEMKKFSKDANNYDKLLEASKAIFDVGFTKLSDKPFSSFFYMMKQVPALNKVKKLFNSFSISK